MTINDRLPRSRERVSQCHHRNESVQYHHLVDSIRDENELSGLLTDDEINAEIKTYRMEKHKAQT